MEPKKAILIKLEKEQVLLIEKAAAYSGITKTAFVRASAIKESRSLIKNQVNNGTNSTSSDQ